MTLTNEEIAERIVNFATEETSDLSDNAFMEVYYEVANQLKTSADAKAEELGE